MIFPLVRSSWSLVATIGLLLANLAAVRVFLPQVYARPALRGAWAGYMDHTIPSYAGTANGCIFEANIDPLLPYLPLIPTLLLYSQRDQTVPAIHGARLRGALPASQLEWLAGNHYAVLTDGHARLSAWLAA